MENALLQVVGEFYHCRDHRSHRFRSGVDDIELDVGVAVVVGVVVVVGVASSISVCKMVSQLASASSVVACCWSSCANSQSVSPAGKHDSLSGNPAP